MEQTGLLAVESQFLSDTNRLLRRFCVCGNDGQISACRFVGVGTTLLPISYRGQVEPEPGGELFLRDAEALSDRGHVNRSRDAMAACFYTGLGQVANKRLIGQRHIEVYLLPGDERLDSRLGFGRDNATAY